MRLFRCALVLTAALVMSGCLTRPAARYYTLDMTPSGKVDPAGACRVDRVRVADALERPELLLQFSSTQVEYYALDRWVSFPGDLVRQKLQAEFSSAAPVCRIEMELTAFQQVSHNGSDEAVARIEAAFYRAAASAGAPAVLEKGYEARVPMAKETPAALAEALSRALEQIASAVSIDAAQLAK